MTPILERDTVSVRNVSTNGSHIHYANKCRTIYTYVHTSVIFQEGWEAMWHCSLQTSYNITTQLQIQVTQQANSFHLRLSAHPDTSANWAENLPSWLAIAKKCRSSVVVVGDSISSTAWVLLGSGEMSLLSMTWPRKTSLSWLNSHLSGFRVSLASCICLRMPVRRASCLCWSWPWMSMSSMWQMVPSSPLRMCCILRWKCSAALLIPNGSLLKTNRPNGLMKAVSIRESSESVICQNPQLASSLLNTCAPANLARFSSTLGNEWTSLRTLSLRDRKSMQLHTTPDVFGTTTIPAHQGVGSSTGEILQVTACVKGRVYMCLWTHYRYVLHLLWFASARVWLTTEMPLTTYLS